MPDDVVVPPTPETPWYSTLSTEEQAGVQVRGWDKLPAAEAAAAAVRAHRAAETMIGIPEAERFRIPANAKPEDLAPVYKRLGVPEKPEEYVFGTNALETPELTTKYTEAVRKIAVEQHLPLQAAQAVFNGVHAFLDAEGKATVASAEAKVTEERAALDKLWGASKDANLETAKRAAARFGLKPEVLNALDSAGGHAATMEFLRNVGSRISEDSLVTGGGSTAASTSTPATIEQAYTRRGEMIRDVEFNKKLDAGDPAAAREWATVLRTLADAKSDGWRPTPGTDHNTFRSVAAPNPFASR